MRVKDGLPTALNSVAVRHFVRGICLVLMLVAIVNWIGWATGLEILTTFVPFWVPMRPWNALWIAGLAGALALQIDVEQPQRFRAARALAVLTALVASMVIYEYASNSTILDLDRWWFRDAVTASPLPLPGRPSQQTAYSALALSVGLALMRVDALWSRIVRVLLVGLASIIPAVAVAGELTRPLSWVHFHQAVQMAPANALCLLSVSAAFFAARPDCAPMSWFMSRPDRASVTRMLVVLFGFPLSVWVTSKLLLDLGASSDTAELFSQGFSMVACGLGVYAVSRQQQQLLLERLSLVDGLETANEHYRLLAENASDLVFSIDVDRRISWMSPSSEPLLGYSPQELIGRPAAFIVHPDDLHFIAEERHKLLQGLSNGVRLRLRARDGASRWCDIMARPSFGADGSYAGVVASGRDVTDEVVAQQAFEHEVAFDNLTGLARKELALQRIAEILEEYAESSWALLCVGVNGMTQINQAYTYLAGDQVLRAVAERLARAVGAHDRVARIAGDEFVVLMPDLVTVTGAAAGAERLLRAVRGTVTVGGTDIEVTASIGIAMAEDHYAEELLRDATAAMRQASSKGSDRWEFLDGNVGEQTREALRIQADLRTALASNRIEAWFMPIVQLPVGGNIGYETLARWRREDGSVWGPDLFLDVAERSGLILELDQSMFRQVCAATLRAPVDMSFGYNVSAASLASESFADWIIEEIDRSGIDPKRLKFEITETAIFHVTPGITHTLARLAAFGIDWWVDDFGTGFSSISHLRDLPIAGLKLDKSFTAELLNSDSHAAQLAQGLLGLAEGLQLSAIAEGVETIEQEAVLIAQGWPLAQGWRYGKPAPATW